MEGRFHHELEQLRMTILQMATLTEKALEKSVRALLERKTEAASEVIARDQEINLLEVAVDKQALRLLALEQPMARDLRSIVGCMKISVELERIGDLAANIARRAIFLTSLPPLPPSPAMEQLAETTIEMLRLVIAAFVSDNAEEAIDVCQMDDRADELNVRILRELLDHMAHDVVAVERSMQTIIAARCLERAADQMTNIAESVIFMVKGVNVKHHCQE